MNLRRSVNLTLLLACLAGMAGLSSCPKHGADIESSNWEDLLVGIPAVELAVEDQAWVVVEDHQISSRSAALLTSPVNGIRWSVVGSVRCYAGLAIVEDLAWLGGGHAPVTIIEYSAWGGQGRKLPAARYSDITGFDRVTGQKLLKPRRYIEGIAANGQYLWAWFMGGMVMMTPLQGEVDWQPHRYAKQLSRGEVHFRPRQGWAWQNLFICLAQPPAHFEEEPVRVGVIWANTPEAGTLLQSPPQFSGYAIQSGALAGDQLWLLWENENPEEGFVGPRWALSTISLPGLNWEQRAVPRDLQAREIWSQGEIAMAVEGNNLVLGTMLGPSDKGDVVLIKLDKGRMESVTRDTEKGVRINGLQLNKGVLWVAHERGVSRVRLEVSENGD